MTAPVKVIRLRAYGQRVHAGAHAQQAHDQIVEVLRASGRVRLDFADVESVGATFLDRSLGTLLARHGVKVLRSIVFAHCSRSVEASIVKTLAQGAPSRGLFNFSG